MSKTAEAVPFRTQIKVEITNFLQKYRTVLLGLIGVVILVIVILAVWGQVDAATKTGFAAKIEKSQTDFTAWQNEADAAKKAELGKTLEAELADIQKNASPGYGFSKAWFLQGNFLAVEKKWPEASKAFRTVFDKDPSSYLAPIALVNAAVSLEEAGDQAGALGVYAEFQKAFAADPVLSAQVLFTQGRLLEAQSKPADAVTAYKKLLEKFPESGWTKLGRDRILLLSQE